MYYLNSRYYDADIGRFINADEAACTMIQKDSIICNIYTYCVNNCINCVDNLGFLSIPTWITSTALDVLFTLLNHFMMSGYIALSGTIWALARNPFTKKLALNIVKTKVVPIYVAGFYSAALTCLRKVLQTAGKIGFEFAKEYGKDLSKNVVLSTLNRWIDTRFLDIITSILTWGGIISLMFDILDGQYDGYITIN